MSTTFTPSVYLRPILNSDGSYTLNLSGFELNELIKAVKYMERQREATRKYRDTKRPDHHQEKRTLTLNIIAPTPTVVVPASPTSL